MDLGILVGLGPMDTDSKQEEAGQEVDRVDPVTVTGLWLRVDRNVGLQTVKEGVLGPNVTTRPKMKTEGVEQGIEDMLTSPTRNYLKENKRVSVSDANNHFTLNINALTSI
jgi:hypothetical protein